MANEVIQTKQWLEQIIIGLNFCPFAKKEFVNDTIDYHLSAKVKIEQALEELISQCDQLAKNAEIETCLIIYKEGFKS